MAKFLIILSAIIAFFAGSFVIAIITTRLFDSSYVTAMISLILGFIWGIVLFFITITAWDRWA